MSKFEKEFKVKGEELLAKIKELIHEGNIRRIIIKDAKGIPYMEIPITVGLVGLVLAPVFTAIAAISTLAANFTIEVVRKDDPEKGEQPKDNV